MSVGSSLLPPIPGRQSPLGPAKWSAASAEGGTEGGMTVPAAEAGLGREPLSGSKAKMDYDSGRG